MLHFTDLNEVFKIKWIIEYIKNKNTVVAYIPQFYIKLFGWYLFSFKMYI